MGSRQGERGHGQVLKVENFHGWLLPHPLDLRPKPDSFRKTIVGFGPPPAGPLLMNWINRLKASSGRGHNSRGPINHPFFKLTSPEPRRKTPERLSNPSPGEETGCFGFLRSPSAKQRCFEPLCVCLLPVCVPSPPVNAILQLLLLLSAGSEIALPPPVVFEIFPGIFLLF